MITWQPASPDRGHGRLRVRHRRLREREVGGSFSAVSTPIFTSKYSFFSIFRDLQSPLSGEKKVLALFFTRKKRTFGGERAWVTNTI